MMDSKQLALKYLMNMCDNLADTCEESIDSLNKKKVVRDLEKDFGNLFSAAKEVIEEFKIQEARVFQEAEKAMQKRKKNI
jgi:hypothetical protein